MVSHANHALDNIVETCFAIWARVETGPGLRGWPPSSETQLTFGLNSFAGVVRKLKRILSRKERMMSKGQGRSELQVWGCVRKIKALIQGAQTFHGHGLLQPAFVGFA